MSHRRIRVAQVITGLVLGGGGQVIASIARNLDKSRFDMHIYCVIEGGEFIDEIRALGFPVQIMPIYNASRTPHSDFRAWMRLMALLRDGQYDVVHTHLYRADVIGRIAALLAGTPVLVKTLHNMGAWKTLGQRGVDFILNSFTDAIVCVSHTQRDAALRLEWIPPHKVQVISNGVDPDRFSLPINRQTVAATVGLDPNRPIVGTVGRLIKEKGHTYLLHAMPEIQRRFPGTQLLIVGDGSLRRSLESHISTLGVRDVAIAGLRADVPQLLGLMDLFVFPSLSEGSPISIFEAMAARRPITCSNIPSLLEIVRNKETALIFEQRDSASLIERVSELLADETLRNALADAAYREVKSIYSNAAMTRAYEDLYSRLTRLKALN